MSVRALFWLPTSEEGFLRCARTCRALCDVPVAFDSDQNRVVAGSWVPGVTELGPSLAQLAEGHLQEHIDTAEIGELFGPSGQVMALEVDLHSIAVVRSLAVVLGGLGLVGFVPESQQLLRPGSTGTQLETEEGVSVWEPIGLDVEELIPGLQLGNSLAWLTRGDEFIQTAGAIEAGFAVELSEKHKPLMRATRPKTEAKKWTAVPTTSGQVSLWDNQILSNQEVVGLFKQFLQNTDSVSLSHWEWQPVQQA